MVKAQEWLEENYPESGCKRLDDKENYGKKRTEIENLDISNQNLEDRIDNKGSYNQGWTNLRRLNMSFNNITRGSVGHNENNISNLEEIDYSHNRREGGIWGGSYGTGIASFPQLKKLNLSHVNIEGVSLTKAPLLTHLDVSNNNLMELDLKDNSNLAKLNCFNNPLLNKLYLPTSFNPTSFDFFDCRGTNLNQVNISSSVVFDCQNGTVYTTSASPTSTISTSPTETSSLPSISSLSSSNFKFESIAIPIASTVGVVLLGGGITYYFIKKRKKNQLLLIAGSNEREIVTNPSELEDKEIIESATIQPHSKEGAHEVIEKEEKDASAHEIVTSSSQTPSKTEVENKQLKEEMTTLKQRLEKMEKVMKQNQEQRGEAQIQVPPK